MMQEADFSIHDSLLGKEAGTPERYDASLLFRIPRSENRLKYGLADDSLPFTGVDVWNCYEFSCLTQGGLPVSRVMKMTCPADSPFLVESKSLKLYLNSFNMERFEPTVDASLQRVQAIITADLSALLQAPVSVHFYGKDSMEAVPFQGIPGIEHYIPLAEQEAIQFGHYEETPSLLTGTPTGEEQEYAFTSDLLRSNCRVTHQPDWGDLFVKMRCRYRVDFASLVQYLVSFRKENHFHEEVVEMIYKRLWDTFRPARLMVAAMYTRRGGIDINPLRCSHREDVEPAFLSPDMRLGRRWRQ